MIGPPVELLRKEESQGRYGLQYDLVFKILPDIEGRQAFWLDDSEGTYLTPPLILRSVNPMAVETMEPGQRFNLVFSPIGTKPVELPSVTCTCGTIVKLHQDQVRAMCSACDAIWVLWNGRLIPEAEAEARFAKTCAPERK